MDLLDFSPEPDDVLEPFAYCTSISAHQPAGSPDGFVTTSTDDSDHLVTVPLEKRYRNVADGPTHILYAPQPIRPLVYQWSGSTYTDCYSLANHTMGMSTPRPSAPSPILAMQDNLLRNFFGVCHIPLLRSPLRNHCTTRFEPYRNDRQHKHHSGAFLCRWDNKGAPCGDELQATPRGILAHLRQDHGVGIGNKETYRCLWITARGRCEEELKFQSFGRHVIKHTGIRMKCCRCGTTMSARNDLITKHRRRHPNCSQADFVIIPGSDIKAPF